jgi:uncharacterized protein (DUF1697 family)
MPRYVAFFRGINVGGKHKIAMGDLRALFDVAGATNVRSYIQSGNVLYDATALTATQISARVETELERNFGFRAPIAVRTDMELAAVLAGNPYLRPDSDPTRLHVVFLSALPEKRKVAALDPNRSPGDAYVVAGREIYLSLPNGAADTKLTNAFFDSGLGVTSTGRNWRTVTTLYGMLKSGG